MPGGRPPKKPEERLRSIHLKLPPDLDRAIRERAKRDGMKITPAIVAAIRAYLAGREGE